MFARSVQIILSSGLLLCAGCASPGYQITLRDGREFLTTTRPEFNSKTGYYKYRNQNGKDALLRSDEILMMHEL